MKELIDKLIQSIISTNIPADKKSELLKIVSLQEKQAIKSDFKLQSLLDKSKTTESVLNNIIEEIEQKNIKIQNYADALEEANKTKDRFFSIIAHDLKSPFNALLGFSKLVKEAFEEKDFDNVKRMNGLIYETLNQTYKLLLNLLDWSRIQTNEIIFRPEKISINKLIEENVKFFKAQANKKGIVLEFNSKEVNYIFADVDMTNIIIRNLISNAVKYTKKGNVKISISRQNNVCNIKISDTGVGIKKEDINNIFNVGDNISTNDTEGERGTGLGLILCKEYANKSGGSLFVESIVNKGSVFILSLPAYK